MLDQEDWRCPTCLDLCFKPAVNSGCGHVFCFWCIHKAMSPYAPSACPICRTKYANLPAICPKLHQFLGAQFPAAYAQRREETEAEERELGAALPEPQAGDLLPPPAAPGQWRTEHFLCDNPRCSRLLCRPLVLNCGHAVCQPTCLRSEHGSNAVGAAAAAAGAAPAGAAPAGAAPAGSPSGAELAPAGASPTTGGGTAYECPACGLAAWQAPAVCKQMSDLLVGLFPQESRQRELECQHELAAQRAQQATAQSTFAAAAAAAAAAPAPAPAAGSADAGWTAEREEAELVAPRSATASTAGGSAAGGDHAGEDERQRPRQQQQQQQQHQVEPSTDRQAQAGQQQAHPGGQQQQQQTPLWEEQEEQQQRSLSPVLTSALRRRQAAGGAQQAVAERLEQSLQRMAAGEGYAWHGVGCDGCGQYPIIGRRYQCQDCPEAIGFDLCGACKDRGLSDIVGRFNQRHTPEHRMRLMRPRVTAMHMLQAANPELPMEQLMWLLQLATTEPEEEEEQQQQQQRGEGGLVEAQQQLQAQQQAGLPQNGGNGGAGASSTVGGGGGSSGGGTQGPPAGGAGPAAAGVEGGLEMLPVLRRGPRPAYDPTAEEPSPSAYAPQQPQPQQPPLHGPARAEAEGLIQDDEGEEEQGDVTTVHVPLERLL